MLVDVYYSQKCMKLVLKTLTNRTNLSLFYSKERSWRRLEQRGMQKNATISMGQRTFEKIPLSPPVCSTVVNVRIFSFSLLLVFFHLKSDIA